MMHIQAISVHPEVNFKKLKSLEGTQGHTRGLKSMLSIGMSDLPLVSGVLSSSCKIILIIDGVVIVDIGLTVGVKLSKLKSQVGH